MNEIGRLDSESKKQFNQTIEDIFKNLDQGNTRLAEKKLIQNSRTPNYFIREYIGRKLTEYENTEVMVPIAEKMLTHRIYGVRATALFYLFNINRENPDKVLELLELTYGSVPWEVESVINDMWKNYPDIMKDFMTGWVESDNSQKRSLSFHGMENIANIDPIFIMNFIGKVIDDDTMEVQKKITHILTQVARVNPINVYPYVREWLAEADETRTKTIWVSMKKLANIVVQKNRRDYKEEFVILTEQTVEDWRNDENENVSQMGDRLARIIWR